MPTINPALVPCSVVCLKKVLGHYESDDLRIAFDPCRFTLYLLKLCQYWLKHGLRFVRGYISVFSEKK